MSWHGLRPAAERVGDRGLHLAKTSQPPQRGSDVRKPVLYTVGHSTRPIGDFLKLLEAHGIQTVVDVRTIPRSRHNPQYDQTALRQTLNTAHIRYQHLRPLGGRRHARKDSPNAGWINASFRGFADHMQSKDFQDGLRRLEAEARKRVTAIMCAEGFVARCHRSLIADALVVDGWRVLHIQSRKTASAHHRTPFLKVRRGRLLYPKPAQPDARFPSRARPCAGWNRAHLGATAAHATAV